MKRQLVCLLLMVLVLTIGCGNKNIETSMEAVVAEDVQVSGTVVTTERFRIDISERNRNVERILICQWLDADKTRLAIESQLNDKSGNHFFVIYLPEQDIFQFERYGKAFLWQEMKPESLMYVQDYSEEGGTIQVRNYVDTVLFTTGKGEYIRSISYVPNGLQVDVVDENDVLLRSVIMET